LDWDKAGRGTWIVAGDADVYACTRCVAGLVCERNSSAWFGLIGCIALLVDNLFLWITWWEKSGKKGKNAV